MKFSRKSERIVESYFSITEVQKSIVGRYDEFFVSELFKSFFYAPRLSKTVKNLEKQIKTKTNKKEQVLICKTPAFISFSRFFTVFERRGA